MLQNKQKRTRKSKLAPRNCNTDDELNIIQSLQENPSNMAVIDDECVMAESQRQFSVKVEVEPCNDIIDTAESNDSNNRVVPATFVKPKDLGFKRFAINPEEIIKEMETISRTTTNLADQLLSIELRNYLGRVVFNKVEETSQDIKIQNALWKWRNWKQNKTRFREPPLCYKCYICKKAWWHLNPFREHLSQHDEKNLKVELEGFFHECNFVACLDYLPKYEEIHVEGKCWKCNKTFAEHISCKRSKYFYVCTLCNAKHYSCVLLRDHEGTCEMYRRALSNGDIQVSYKLDRDKDLGLTIITPKNLRCHLCNLICFSNNQLFEHMTLRHSVRSDVPEACLPPRPCPACGDKVVNQNLHPCKIKRDHSSCNYCCRKFQNKLIASLHMDRSQDDVQCRVCSTYLPKQCMEMEHLVEHSDNYKLVYKCLLCPNISYCLSESSIRKHRIILHKKHDIKQSFYELIFIPKGCIENSTHEYLEVKPQDTEKNKMPLIHSDFQKNKNANDSNIIAVNDEVDLGNTNSRTDIDDNAYLDNNVTEETTKMYSTDISSRNSKKSNNKKNNSKKTIEKTVCIGNSTAKTDINDRCFIPKKQINDKINITTNVNTETECHSKVNCFTIEVDNIKKELNGDEENSELFEIENEILKVFQASKRFNITAETDNMSITEEIEIKSEPLDEEDYEDDIIVLRMDDSNTETDFNVSNSDLDAQSHIENVDSFNVASEELSIRQQNSQVKVEENMNEETNNIYNEAHESLNVIGDESLEVMLVPIEPKIIAKSYKKRKLYKCPKCQFKGYHREYRNHIYKSKHVTKSPAQNFQIISIKKFKCTKCDTTFNTLSKYAMHFKHHNLQENACPQCREISESITKHVSHISVHIKQMITKVRSIESGESNTMETYRCNKCNLNVEDDNLFSHWENHLDLKDVTVNKSMSPDVQKSETKIQRSLNHKLHKQLTDLLQMSRHVRRARHTNFRECIICSHNFDRTSDWKRHLIEHLLVNAYAEYTRNRGLACQICSKVFQKSDHYKQHMRDHGGLPVYKCELCNKTFGDSSNFSKHKKVHNLAVMVCDICKKKFQSKHTLEMHILMHMTTDPILCNLCPKIFYTNSAYKKHVTLVHEGRKQLITCKLCTMTFKSFKFKWDHMWTAHKIRKYKADCPSCNLSFRKFFDLRKHCREEHNIFLRKLNNKNEDHQERTNINFYLEEEHGVCFI